MCGNFLLLVHELMSFLKNVSNPIALVYGFISFAFINKTDRMKLFSTKNEFSNQSLMEYRNYFE